MVHEATQARSLIQTGLTSSVDIIRLLYLSEARMSSTEVLLYQELDGTVPVLDWLKELQRTNKKAFEKCLFLLDLLEEFGHDLRRPRADLLREGVYELRTEVRNV